MYSLALKWMFLKYVKMCSIHAILGQHLLHVVVPSGGRLNKKDGLTTYGDSHVKDKTS